MNGHQRKLLVIIDETPECRCAVVYASQSAKNTNSKLVFLFVIDPSDFHHFMGVGDIMRAEAEECAKTTLKLISDEVRSQQGIDAEMIVREGQKSDEILQLIEQDQDISLLILASGSSINGPGPLVQSIAGRAFPIPVTVIPDGLSDEDIAALT